MQFKCPRRKLFPLDKTLKGFPTRSGTAFFVMHMQLYQREMELVDHSGREIN
jgi:hypothetical protein